MGNEEKPTVDVKSKNNSSVQKITLYLFLSDNL